MRLRATTTAAAALDGRPAARHAAAARRRGPVDGRAGRPDHADLRRPGRRRAGGRGTGLRAVRRRLPGAPGAAAAPHGRAVPAAALGVGARTGGHRPARSARAGGHGRRPWPRRPRWSPSTTWWSPPSDSTRPPCPTGGVGIGVDLVHRPAVDRAGRGARPWCRRPTTLGALVSVTNCGNVPEVGVTVTVTVAPADPAGRRRAAGRRSGRPEPATVSIASGASAAPTLAPAAGGVRATATR